MQLAIYGALAACVYCTKYFPEVVRVTNNDFFFIFIFSDKEANTQRLSIVKYLDQVRNSIKKISYLL